MFSMPPAIAQSTKPSMISCAAEAMACAPEPQTRFTVMAGTSTGSPPWIAACRAGFILLPAWMTLPITTVWTLAWSSLACASTARTAVAPSSVAGVSFRLPPKVPMAVRRGAERTTGRCDMGSLLLWTPRAGTTEPKTSARVALISIMPPRESSRGHDDSDHRIWARLGVGHICGDPPGDQRDVDGRDPGSVSLSDR